jgi:hypothetical protein
MSVVLWCALRLLKYGKELFDGEDASASDFN